LPTAGVDVPDPVIEASEAELSPLALERDRDGFRVHDALGDGVVVAAWPGNAEHAVRHTAIQR
jgi:hypothetical protein